MPKKDKILKVQVYTIVKFKDKFLLLHRSEDLDVWEFPGGSIEFGENPKKAAIRELFEETAINVKDVKLFDVTSVVYPDNKTMQIPIFFIVEISKVPFINLREHSEYKWVDIKEAKKLNLALSVISVLKKLENTFSSKKDISLEALLNKIKEDVIKLPHFVDLIDRSNPEKIEGWSDLDITLVFKKIDYELLVKLRKMLKNWEEYGKKIDMMIITLEDNPLLPYHFHGGYQLTYLDELKNAKSFFNIYPLTSKKSHNFKYLQIDCFRTMALKIQEIRRTIVTGRVLFFSRKLSGDAVETMHILKKCKTIRKMAAQILKFSKKKPLGIEKELHNFDKVYYVCRKNWNKICENGKILKKYKRYCVEFAEKVYSKIVRNQSNIF
ncbi:MAG: NUDIX hydrolase [Nanopusillaceae archaeon]